MADDDRKQAWQVAVPVVGTCHVGVFAATSDEAFDDAINAVYERLEAEGIGALENYEAVPIVAQGNFWLVDAHTHAIATSEDGEEVQAPWER